MALNRENVIRAAEKYVSKGKLEAAIKEYRKVLASNPNDANTLNRVGDLYARIERFDEAVKLFSQIAEQYTRDGFFVKAIAIYKKIIKLDPTSLTVYERLAELYHKQGLLNEARTQYQVLADYYQKHDNAASAITIYQRMAEFEPDNPTFHLKLAELYESQRLVDKAMKEYRLLADLLIVGGSVDEAAQVYLKALEVNSEDLEFARDAVAGLHDAGHVGEAARVLARAVELNPAAASLAQQVGLGQEDDELSGVDAPATVQETSSFEIPEESTQADLDATDAAFASDDSFGGDSFGGDETFATDDAFTLPEASFDGLEDALEETRASASAAAAEVAPLEADDGDDVFTFDLDDDEVPSSLVTPPADMMESDAVGLGAPSSDASADDVTFDSEISFELDPEVEPAAETSTPDPVAETTDEPQALEIDWPDDLEELELPVSGEPVSVDPGAAADFDLDETVPGQRVASGLDPLELEDFELGEPGLEPVEHSAGVEHSAAVEAEEELELLDFEPVELESTASDLGGLELEDPDIAADDGGMGSAYDERREEDLLAEARVFAKYGLQEKARDRLSELFQMRPDHLEALELQTRIDLEAGQLSEVVSNANLVSRIANESGKAELWTELRGSLSDAGFILDGDRVIGEPGAKVVEDDRIAQLLDDLSLESFDAPVTSGSGSIPLPGAQRPAASAPSPVPPAEPASASLAPVAAQPDAAQPDAAEPVAAEPDAAEPVAAEPVAAEPVAAEPVAAQPDAAQPVPAPAQPVSPPSQLDVSELMPDDDDDLMLDAVEAALPTEAPQFEEPVPESGATAPTTGKPLVSLVDELGLDELEAQLNEDLASDADGAPTEAASDPLDETGMSWLDEIDSEDPKVAAEEETIFEEEDDFFDLAAELERELSEDDGSGVSLQPQEQSLEDIIEGFKQGVAENLSPEDYDTHFNLGIAYREMGLLDEAIGEFQLAAKDERYVVDSCSLLGICFLEKGLPELAVRSYRKGLESTTISDDATLGLLYDMGTAYHLLGDNEAAYKTFVEVYGRNSHYRDVATKVEELKAQQQA
ncbi:MAG: tetratricopeptide repeat protein [Acidobacteriota bacterium]